MRPENTQGVVLTFITRSWELPAVEVFVTMPDPHRPPSMLVLWSITVMNAPFSPTVTLRTQMSVRVKLSCGSFSMPSSTSKSTYLYVLMLPFTELVARAREPEPHFTIVPVAATGHVRETSPETSKVIRVPDGKHSFE